MTTTVTTVTISTVTTLGLGVTMGVAVTVLLIGLLAGREVAGAADGARSIAWRRASVVAIVPLLFSFALIVALQLAQAA